jgi:hypothetical protein
MRTSGPGTFQVVSCLYQCSRQISNIEEIKEEMAHVSYHNNQSITISVGPGIIRARRITR